MRPFVVASIVALVLIAGGAMLASDLWGARGPAVVPVSQGAPLHQAAATRTVALAVDNMSCASCPYIVKQALEGTAGVIAADVSFREKRARVTYDPTETEVAALVRATSELGYPSRPVGN